MGFIIIVLTVASFALYYYFRETSYEALEYRLISWADDLVLDIAKDVEMFKNAPQELVYSKHIDEFVASGMLVQFMDPEGRVIARSPGLKLSSLPFTDKEDDVINDIRMSDGTELKVYQRQIEIDGRVLGYVMVGFPTYIIARNVDKLLTILTVVMLCTIIIMIFGINILTSLDKLANQKKFLSFASHELRTPLSVISGHAEVALRNEQSIEQYKETLSLIKEESDWLKRMVANLLMVFRSESGMERTEKAEFNYGELVVDEASALKERYPDKDITLNLCEEAQIKADPGQIKNLVKNILENAAKYSGKKGKIDIDLKSEKNRLILKVSDNGVGIEKQLLKKIFDPFYRIESTEGEGMGLGLAIVKWVVDAHRGRIKVESEKGKGSVFRITLPKK